MSALLQLLAVLALAAIGASLLVMWACWAGWLLVQHRRWLMSRRAMWRELEELQR